ncbi:MAG TPA: polysaccharide deacetylase family protein, partial [Dehalococcoidia bacterium]|nr:polysaccharide deacetylase family protein [Dehalococcoidia bacterium]
MAALAAAAIFVLPGCGGSDDPPPSPTPEPPAATATRPPAPTTTPTPEPTPEPTATPAPRITRPPGEVALGNTERREMALTFDCGASGVPTPAILDALREAGVRSTFFLTGQWATTYPDLTRRIAAEHEVANHSWSHPDFRELSDAQVLAEMERAEEALRRVAGVSTRPLWRAPYGA